MNRTRDCPRVRKARIATVSSIRLQQALCLLPALRVRCRVCLVSLQGGAFDLYGPLDFNWFVQEKDLWVHLKLWARPQVFVMGKLYQRKLYQVRARCQPLNL